MAHDRPREEQEGRNGQVLSDYELRSDIPVPRKPVGGRAKYPFWDMAVGDSFAVSADELKRVQTAASQFGRRHDQRFTVQQYRGGYRCWRVK